MVSVFIACSPISFKHMHVWCEFLDPHLTTHGSHIGVQVIGVFDVDICLPRMACGLPRDLCHPVSNSESCSL
jgi:hypothetical protein